MIGIRADMDALWQQVDGNYKANHSCGHDAHMAMVLGLLWKVEQAPELSEKIALKFIFQPAEEKGAGALKMVEKGAVDNVDYLYGIHLRPKQEMKMGDASPVIQHGAVRMYDVEIKGKDAHGARPHLNHNAIELGSQIVQLLAKIHVDPTIPHSIKMTRFHAGGKNVNIIPGSASFSLDLRAQTNEVMGEIEEQVQRIFESLRNLYPVIVEVTHIDSIAAAMVNTEAIDIMSMAIKRALGGNHLHPPLITPGGDDFHFYTLKRPSLKATMIGLGCNLEPGLHHPSMTFNHEALTNGIEILYQAVLATYQYGADAEKAEEN